MTIPQFREPIRGSDYLLLTVLCVVLFGSCLLAGRSLSGHEAVQPQSAREMQAHQDWLIPTLGGLPWLERPPLPHWVLIGVGSLFGGIEQEWVARCVPILFAVPIVLIVAGVTGMWFGRVVALVAGAVLATMGTFFKYATNPEADMFLCLFVTSTVGLFAWLEFRGRKKYSDESTSFFGKRPWPVLAFFILLGLTNWAKGLLFGTAMAGLPVAAYMIAQGRWHYFKRYMWLWGWLTFAIVWLAWALPVYLRHPDVIELWLSDYMGRLNENFMGQPWWYYLAAVPRVCFPWTIAAILGLVMTGRKAFSQNGPERFLWLWAIVPPLVFSLSQGKHHHYLLQCLAPWTILASLALVRFWQFIPKLPVWFRNPLGVTSMLGIAGDLALWFLRDEIPGPSWLVPALMAVWPAAVLIICWTAQQRDGRISYAGVFGVVAVMTSATYFLASYVGDSYRVENQFLRHVQQTVPNDKTILICSDLHVLETFRLLYYTGDRAKMIHNPTFLLDSRVGSDEVYVLARKWQQPEIAKFGQTQVMLESPARRHDQRLPQYRRVLYHVRFHDHVERRPVDVRISVMQAVHREVGPFLGQ